MNALPIARDWEIADAERYLLSLEMFGMRFGLDRMRRMMTVLGHPQRSFDAIQVVGTNGKSSTARMLAAILTRHGLRTGTYLSPHLLSFAERVRVEERDIEEAAFAAAVNRAARAAASVDRTLSGAGDRVTQFEALTAAAYSELSRAGVGVAVVEAGLGGRYDATSVVEASIVVLTNVGLEHTRWLGPTVTDIAGEKLAVVGSGCTLVIASDLHPEARAVAESVVERQGATLLIARPLHPPPELRAQGRFQQLNFSIARAAAQAYLRRSREGIRVLDERAVLAAGGATAVPGRFQLLGSDPPTVLDGAHNPDGVAALADTLSEWSAGRPVTAVVSVLEDKDAAGMLRILLPHCARLICTATTNRRALPAGTLASLAGQLGMPGALVDPDPTSALALARSSGGDGVVLATGSIYLVADLLRAVTSNETG